MGSSDGERVLSYPIPSEAALEPPQEWAQLRQECPVARVTLPSGDEASLITRYDDVKAVLSDPRLTRGVNAPGAARVSASRSGVFSTSAAEAIPEDSEGHQRWRRMVSKWFTAKRMNAMRPEIEAMTEQLVDEMVDSGAPVDLKAILGFPLPVWVICGLLGVPDSDRGKFAYWSDTFLSLTRYADEEIDAAQVEFVEYMSAHIEAKRTEPGDDLLSQLITGTDSEGERMPDAMLVATGQGLLVAGHETTANMIGKMVALLLADRSRWEQLVADRSLVRTAVEEVLRFDPNGGFGLPRFVAEDTEIAGTLFPGGTTLVCNMSAANRDDAVFDGAGEMDLTRSPNTHLSFGSGAHSCLGQALARTELQVVLDVLLRRLPTLELAVDPGDLQRIEGLAVGGLREVPVRW